MIQAIFNRGGIGKNPLLSQSLAPVRCLAISRDAKEAISEDEHQEARNWLSGFSIDSVPKSACEVTFSRSSGPGGQNVNKYVNHEFMLSTISAQSYKSKLQSNSSLACQELVALDTKDSSFRD